MYSPIDPAETFPPLQEPDGSFPRSGSPSLEAVASTALETSPHVHSRNTTSITVRRQAIVAALTTITREDTPPDDPDQFTFLGRLARKIDECGRHAWICQDDETSQPHLTVNRCKSRLCPTCGDARSRRVAAHVLQYALKMDSRRFLTLTVASRDDGLRAQITRLTSAFARLRRSKWWKRLCPAGIYTIEITYNQKTDRWHPHLHAIIDGKFIPQATLAAKWEAITTDSRIVDIRQVHSARTLAQYLAKYVAKTQTLTNLPAHRLAEWAEHVHGLRLVNTFGQLHGTKIDRATDRPRPKLKRLTPIEPVKYAAGKGDALAGLIMEQLPNLLDPAPSFDQMAFLAAVNAWITSGGVQRLKRIDSHPATARPPDPPRLFEPRDPTAWTSH